MEKNGNGGGRGLKKLSPLERALGNVQPAAHREIPEMDARRCLEKAAPHPESETERAPTARERLVGTRPLAGED